MRRIYRDLVRVKGARVPGKKVSFVDRSREDEERRNSRRGTVSATRALIDRKIGFMSWEIRG